MRLEAILSGLGYSVRWLIDPANNDLSRAPPPVKIERTSDGGFKVGGFQFASETQALEFIKRRKLKLSDGSQSSDATTGQLRTNQTSQKDERLMSEYDIQRSEDGGYRAAGYVFRTLDQAVDWAKRRRTTPNLVLRSNQPTPAPVPRPPSTPPVNFVLVDWVQRVTSSGAPVPAARWLSEPTTLSAGGFTFTTDLIHFGRRDPKDYQRNKALIDPMLKVASTGDPFGTTLPYWPDYESLDPRARRTYLEWLQNGRRDPETPIGYVFTFFYGLEYHLLKEEAHDEVGAILSEVRRLLEVYGEHRSFWRYATSLIEVAELIAGEDDDGSPAQELQPQTFWQMPLKLRVRLGRKVAHGTPIDAADALAWLLGTGTYLRTPAQRCLSELSELFAKRFEKRWPQGILVPVPKGKLRYYYRAAGANFTAEVSVGELPDVASLNSPLNRFKTLLDRCTDDLDAYSRFLGRSAANRGTLAAATLLPIELQEGESGNRLRACRTELIACCLAETPMAIGKVMNALEIDVPQGAAKIPVPLQSRMASMLDMFGIGYEPDRRYGAKAMLAADAKLALFEMAGGGKVDPSRAPYHAARTMVEIAALAASSDGEIVAAEVESINRDIASFSDLDDVERRRLGALALALLSDPPKRKEAIDRLSQLPEPVRRKIINSAVGAIVADGQILPTEVRFLEGLHLALGLPQQDAYALLHRASEDGNGPVTIATEKRSRGVKIPREPSRKEGAVEIDSSRLERIRNETRQVSELLADIFVDEAEVVAAVSPVAATKSRFDRLEQAYGELLWSLLAKPLPAQEFDALARSMKLLPEGAIEAINDWGFDTFDEPIIENDAVIYVHEEVADRLRTMGEMV